MYTRLKPKPRDGLARCVGYRVDSPDGRVGSVAAVLPPAGARRHEALLVHTGLLQCELTPIAADRIATVDARRRRVILRPPPAKTRHRGRARSIPS